MRPGFPRAPLSCQGRRVRGGNLKKYEQQTLTPLSSGAGPFGSKKPAGRIWLGESSAVIGHAHL